MRQVIINEVNRLIKTYHTRNPFEIAEMMNIEIVYHDLGNRYLSSRLSHESLKIY